MTESDVKTKLVSEIRRLGGYASRIEDQYRVGFPDMIIIPPGQPVFFAEVKLVRALSFGPSPRQFVELQRLRVSRHGVPLLVGFKDKFYLSTVKQTVKIDDCTAQHENEDFLSLLHRWWFNNER